MPYNKHIIVELLMVISKLCLISYYCCSNGYLRSCWVAVAIDVKIYIKKSKAVGFHQDI